MMNSKISPHITFYKCAIILMLFVFAGCSSTKNIPANDALYTGATIKLKNTPVSKKETKIIKTDLEGLLRPKPNSKLFGARIKLGIYNMAGKKNKGLSKLLKKFGEPPVLLSQVNLDKNNKVLENTLENKGFFHAEVTSDTTVKHKKADASYEVVTGSQYKINAVYFPTDSGQIGLAINQTIAKTILKKGEAFNLDVVKGERLRIDAALKEKGFYFFNPEQLIINVDSTIGNDQVNLYVKLKPEVPDQAKIPYSIRDVYIYSNFNLASASRDTMKVDTASHSGYYVIDRKNTFKPAVFDRIMTFDPGDTYNRTDHNTTLNRLINLGAFKFVKNRFQLSPDSSSLDSYYYLTPLKKKSLSAEVGVFQKQSTVNGNANGSQLTLKWRNRNTFRGAELLTLSGYGGFEVQYGQAAKGYNTFRVGAEANLSYPRFIIPVFKINTKSSFVPRTNFQLGYDVFSRQKIYTLNSFRAQYGYVWKESAKKEHQLNPIAISYVLPLNVTQQYLDSIRDNPILQRAIDTQFVIGSNYNFNYNSMVDKPKNATGVYFNGLVDVSGNIAGLASGADVKNGDTSRIFKLNFSQYIKTEVDLRYYRKVGLSHQWASRFIVGVGLPYGNSTALPFSKQFFVGGSNSLRAFRSSSLGPGTSTRGVSANEGGFFTPSTGDIKLEFNTEFRAKLYSIFSGALFVDVGNIWLYNEFPGQPGTKFSKDFMKELAVGAGAGLRIDVTILLLRLDVAVPLRKPYLPESERWVTNKIGFGELVYNLAIGLPF